MIQIKPNDYAQFTEVHKNVVQLICDTFLDGHTYHPHNGDRRGYRNAHKYIAVDKRTGKNQGFTDNPLSWQNGVSFNGAEMARAFNELTKAGYYMLRISFYGSWTGYNCSKRPFDNLNPGAQIVTEFTERID